LALAILRSTRIRTIPTNEKLFTENHCAEHKNPANQLFCSDPEFNVIGAKLASAIQERLNRLPDRRIAIEENTE
jgi:hypothetical protein